MTRNRIGLYKKKSRKVVNAIQCWLGVNLVLMGCNIQQKAEVELTLLQDATLSQGGPRDAPYSIWVLWKNLRVRGYAHS